MTAFDITQEYQALEALLMEVNEETGEFLHTEDEVKEFVDELKKNKEVKLNSIQDYKLSNNGAISALDEKIKKLQGRKKSLQTLNSRLQEIQEMLLEGEKFKTSEYTFSYRKVESVEVPENFVDSLSDYIKVEKKWDKTALKKMLKKSEIDYSEFGINLLSKQSLSIR